MSDPLMKMTKKWKVKPSKMDRTTTHAPAKLEECQFSWNLEEAGVPEMSPMQRSYPPQYYESHIQPPGDDCRSLSRQRSMPNIKKLTDHALMIEKARQQVQHISINDQQNQSPPLVSPQGTPIPTAQLRPLKRHKSFNSIQEVVPAAMAQELRNMASAPSVPHTSPSHAMQHGRNVEQYEISDYDFTSSRDQSPLVRSQSDGAPSNALRKLSDLAFVTQENAQLPFYTNVSLNGLMSTEYQPHQSMPDKSDPFLSSLTSRFHQFQVPLNNHSGVSTANAGFCGVPHSPQRETSRP